MLPPEFVGLWERVALVVDGEEVPDAGTCWWFQAAERFLDVRSGGAVPGEAFAGVTHWDPSREELTWIHEVDRRFEEVNDVGHVEWRHGDLIEHGTAEVLGQTIEYTETWRQSSHSDHPVVLADRVGGQGRLGICGQVGAVLILDPATRSVGGGLMVDRGWGWEFLLVIGSSLGAAKLEVPHEPGTAFECFGQRWVVSDRSARPPEP